MNYEKRFLEIRNFLKTHEYLHELEMLERFEKPLSPPYDKWSDELKNLDLDQLRDIENNMSSKNIQDKDLKEFINQIHSLSTIPKSNLEELKFSDKLKRKMNKKKVHEIGLINSLLKDDEIKHFIDIGSGAGHLSSVLVNEKRTSTCIDLNSEFQKIGIKKLKRWTPSLVDKINFVQLEVSSADDLKIFHNSESMTLGLHACGPLSTTIVKLRSKRMLNFSCCYHKLNDEYNISDFSKKNQLWFTNHALTSAAKGFAVQSGSDFEQKYKVKSFRYSLHFLLKNRYSLNFVTIGNAKPSDYDGCFFDYCNRYSPQKLNEKKQDILKYYQENNSFIRKVINTGTLRALLGRLIELYIILDRAIYLQENNLEPKVFELFARELSPRNIALFI